MTVNIPAIVRSLTDFATEIALSDRIVDGVEWYRLEGSDLRYRYAPILPRAVHDALCPQLSVLIDDQAKEILVCDTCSLAIENGAG